MSENEMLKFLINSFLFAKKIKKSHLYLRYLLSLRRQMSMMLMILQKNSYYFINSIANKGLCGQCISFI
jgi:hypothetical protein